MPPTPPAHSRTSSSSHSVNASILSPLQTPAQSSEDVQSKTNPSTPLNQRSPPTPEVTPPQPSIRPKTLPLRPPFYDRIPSKCTTDSRTESFKTALESPEVSDAEDSRSTLRPPARSARTSQLTVRQVSGSEKKPPPRESGLELGIESDFVDGRQSLTPRSKSEFNTFDGEWGSGSEVEQEWDDNLMRNVIVRKRLSKTHAKRQGHEVADNSTVPPTNATRAPRALPLQGRILTYDPVEPSRRSFTAPEAAGTTASTGGDQRRMSGMSSKSTTSTIVEAILVETVPRRQKTLRHVKRVNALRDSVWQPSPVSSATTLQENVPRRRLVNDTRDAPRDSYASNSSINSIASRKARREVWKNGAIPVVVVPDRRTSNRSTSRDRSLRSMSSKRSERRQSIGSVPLTQVPKDLDLTSYFDRPSKRGRRLSESDGSTPGDQRTIDYPPIVPQRTSSLSAPTSRNVSREASLSGSRAGSLTAESLRAHNTFTVANGVSPTPSHPPTAPSGRITESSVPVVTVNPVPSYDQLKANGTHEEHEQRHDKNLDVSFGSPMLSAQETPFSQTSVDTNGTAPEIEQAMAISIVPHQNRSILVVDHKPSDSLDDDRRSHTAERAERPVITTTEFTDAGEIEGELITPPQVQPSESLHNVDSPLRNPRSPPVPPVLQFIPATPSGLTPADERPKLLGNFYEAVEDKPSRGLSIVRRALGSRRHSSYGPSPVRDPRPGFLTRTFSLSRNTRKDDSENLEFDQDSRGLSSEQPRDESRLHPDWHPAYDAGIYDDEDYGGDEGGEAWRYPPIDNRPRLPKRTLSERMKRTFAILPVQTHHDVYTSDGEPERRTIRRTSSGSLRVVKRRGSVGSFREQKNHPPKTSETRRQPFFARSYSFGKNSTGSRDSDTESQRTSHRGRRWSLTQSLPGIPRRLSEKRREKRSNELRQKISGPQAVRDGVGDIIRHDTSREVFHQPQKAEHAIRV